MQISALLFKESPFLIFHGCLICIQCVFLLLSNQSRLSVFVSSVKLEDEYTNIVLLFLLYLFPPFWLPSLSHIIHCSPFCRPYHFNVCLPVVCCHSSIYRWRTFYLRIFSLCNRCCFISVRLVRKEYFLLILLLEVWEAMCICVDWDDGKDISVLMYLWC